MGTREGEIEGEKEGEGRRLRSHGFILRNNSDDSFMSHSQGETSQLDIVLRMNGLILDVPRMRCALQSSWSRPSWACNQRSP